MLCATPRPAEEVSMPWMPEVFTAPLAQAPRAEEAAPANDAIAYYEGIMADEPNALVRSFAAQPVLDDPRVGYVEGARRLRAFVNGTAEWLRERDAERTLKAIRVYHSMWPLTGEHRLRSPLLPADPGLQAEGTPGDYQRALAEGDLQAIVGTFETDGYAREPSGGAYLHRGAEGLRELYAHLFANRGGIGLEHCTLTDDGVRCAIEYNCVRWGVTDIPPQAGVAVYERGSSGLLAAARIYDDVEPPAVSDTSAG